ncbi:polysaccharide pyruvyl transferase family protein [Streptomyces sp. NPDC060194]|uniref:polysaccharide pyruvyl transferase family protein n=1 Tax=Streptomyces sp. NPDC060194 TaxID=3347069 RepID=UPI0036592F85
MTSENREKRILLRSGKSPFDVVPLEQAMQDNVFATNTGNLIFSEASHKILEAPRTEIVSGGARTADPAAASRINAEYDAYVVPLANAFRPSFEGQLKRLTQLIRRLDIPVVVLGVGAQTGLSYDPSRLKAMEPTVKAFVSAVLDRSATIGVRGEFTESYLNDLGFRDVEVIGCPSMFMNGGTFRVDKRAEGLTADSRIAVNGSHSAVRSGVGAIVSRTHRLYPNLQFIGQNLVEAQQLHWRDLSDPVTAPLTTIPTHPAHPMFGEDKVRVYVDPQTWIGALRDMDFSFGSRIHGNIAALLAGTPAMVLCHDSRTLELCRYFGIPHRKLTETPKDVDPADLYEQADFSELVDGHRERFDRFTGFLDKNGLQNTFTHGDGGAAFDARLAKQSFPAGVRPWNDTGIDELAGRLAWLQGRVQELSSENTKLRTELGRSVRARTARTAAAVPQQRRTGGSLPVTVYRTARRAVGPIKRALRPE